MSMQSTLLLVAAAWAVAILGRPVTSLYSCKDLTLRVSASATHIEVPPLSDLKTSAGVGEFIAQAPIIIQNGTPVVRSGTFDISARYCPPRMFHRGCNDRIQLLVHGATYTKEYWATGAWGDRNQSYSWSKFANEAGYATLAVDRLGNGASSLPDPLQITQLPLQVEVLHHIIQRAKRGEFTGQPSKVIFVGHSYGSVAGFSVAQQYPADIEKFIVTGCTSDFGNMMAATADLQPLAASAVDPSRFSGYAHGYLTHSAETGRTSAFYTGAYDPAIPPKDYATKETVTVGELISFPPLTISAYNGPVLLITGDRDQLFCGVDPPGYCGSQLKPLANSASLFPNASSFEYYGPPDTGHDINFHYSAPVTYKVAHHWLKTGVVLEGP
ncbi:MAG: hypothetical protein M1833_001995 [Piccolia ochrophora]|nr:MAG: hypothetical protein M1833_001995 [Piccolia ochrophora]